MTVSRTAKRLIRLALVALGLAAYVLLVLTCDLGNPWKFLGAMQLRAFIPALALFLLGLDLMRFVHVSCEEDGGNADADAEAEVEGRIEEDAEGRHEEAVDDRRRISPPADFRDGELDPSLMAFWPDLGYSASDGTDGEAIYQRAYAMPHHVIPNFDTDDLYLELLGKSANAGYAPAQVLLGTYAMRRATWVEAYYWMSAAKRQGMKNLTNVMREIRANWSKDGFPDEADNVNPLFTAEAGSLGRALLHVDSGREKARAREFLKVNHPEFLDD